MRKAELTCYEACKHYATILNVTDANRASGDFYKPAPSCETQLELKKVTISGRCRACYDARESGQSRRPEAAPAQKAHLRCFDQCKHYNVFLLSSRYANSADDSLYYKPVAGCELQVALQRIDIDGLCDDCHAERGVGNRSDYERMYCPPPLRRTSTIEPDNDYGSEPELARHYTRSRDYRRRDSRAPRPPPRAPSPLTRSPSPPRYRRYSRATPPPPRAPSPPPRSPRLPRSSTSPRRWPFFRAARRSPRSASPPPRSPRLPRYRRSSRVAPPSPPPPAPSPPPRSPGLPQYRNPYCDSPPPRAPSPRRRHVRRQRRHGTHSGQARSADSGMVGGYYSDYHHRFVNHDPYRRYAYEDHVPDHTYDYTDPESSDREYDY